MVLDLNSTADEELLTYAPDEEQFNAGGETIQSQKVWSTRQDPRSRLMGVNLLSRGSSFELHKTK